MKKWASLLIIVILLFTSIPLSPASAAEERSIYLIKFKNIETGMAQWQQRILHKYTRLSFVSAELTATELSQLIQDQNVEYIEEDGGVIASTVPHLIDSSPQKQKAAPPEGRLPSADYSATGHGVKIAIIDTGIASLASLPVAGGASFLKDDASYEDRNGHGTYVASRIAGFDPQQGISGVAPEASLYALKALNDEGQGSRSQILQAVEWAIDNEMDIIQMSFGTTEYSLALAEAMNLAYEQGIVLIAASGNSGQARVDYPAGFNTVIAVGAVDENRQRLELSNTGSELDVVAPGSDVPGLGLHGEVVTHSGTSGAAAYAAGIAALYRSTFPSLQAAELMELLRTTAEPLGAVEEYGYGMVRYQTDTTPSEEEQPQPEQPGKEQQKEEKLPSPDSQEQAPEDVERLGELRLEAERALIESRRQQAEQQEQLEQELASLSKEDVMEEFHVTDAWVQGYLDQGIRLQELFTPLWEQQMAEPSSSGRIQSFNSRQAMDVSGGPQLNLQPRTVVNASEEAESEVESDFDTEALKQEWEASIQHIPLPEQAEAPEEVGEEEQETSSSEHDEQAQVEDGDEQSQVQPSSRFAIAAATIPDPPEINRPLAKMSEAPFQVGLYGEQISLLSGGLSVSESDLTLPGRNGLSFTLSRTYDSNNAQYYDMDVQHDLVYDGFGFDVDKTKTISKEFYDLTRKYDSIIKKYGCGSDENLGLVWTGTGTGIVTGPKRYDTFQNLQHALVNPPVLTPETRHPCGVQQKNRMYVEEFSFKSNEYTPKYTDYVLDSIERSRRGPYSTREAAQVEYNKVNNGDYHSSGRSGSYEKGYHLYKTYVSTVGSIGYSISEVMPYYTTNTTKDKPEDKRFPIGKGWSWNISYVKRENNRLYLNLGSGGVYEIQGSQLKNYPYSDLSFVTDTSVTYGGRTSSYALKSVYGTAQYFDVNGQLLQIKDAYGNTVSFTYANVSPYGTVLTKITDAVGNVLSIDYSTTQVKLTQGDRIVTYKKTSSDGKELLSQVIDPMNRTTTYNYAIRQAKFSLIGNAPNTSNPYALLTGITHPTGSRTDYTYEVNPVTRFIGQNQVNQSYRIASRKDTVTYSNQTTETYHTSSVVYGGDMGSTYGTNATFTNTLFDGLLETQMTYKKQHVNHEIGAVYYNTRIVVDDGTQQKVTELTYDEAKRRMEPIKASTRYRNKQSQVASPAVVSSQVYDDYKNITSATDPLGKVSTYTYHSTTRRLLSSIEPVADGKSIYTELVSRNAQGDITEMKLRDTTATGAVLQHVEFTYDAYGNVTLVRTKETNRNLDTQIVYGSAYSYAYPTQITMPYKDADGISRSQVVKATYNASTGTVASYVDGNNQTTSYTYDKLGRMLEMKHPDGKTITFTIYDVANEIRQTDELGRIRYVKWNPLGMETESGWIENGTLKAKTKNGYNSYGQLSWSEDTLGNRSVFTYDKWGRGITVTLPNQSKTTVAYDDLYNTIVSTDADGNSLRETRDEIGRVIKKEEKQGSGYTTVWTGSYDPASRLIREQDAKNLVTQYTYSLLGQLVGVTNANQESYQYAYNRAGQLTRTTYPDQTHTTKEYDERGQLIRATDPESRVQKHYYDGNGNRIKRVDKKGQSFAYSYSNRGLLLNKQGPTETISYTYDADGSRKTMTDRTGTTTYTYKAYTGELASVKYPDGKQLSYAYNSAGNRSQLVMPFGDTVSYSYNKVNQLTELKWNNVTQASYTYTAAGRMKTQQQANGVVSEYGYSFGKLSELKHQRSAALLKSYSYTHDANQNITKITESRSSGVENRQFTYDALNRISTSSYNNEAYSYDVKGNRATYTTDSTDSLMLDDVAYTYDEWDRLTKVEGSNGKTVEYSYNGDNLLVERKENGVRTRYYYDGANIVAEGTVQSNGTVVEKASYLRGNALVMREDAASSKGYYLHNGHGDVVGIRNASGAVVNEYEYDLWGKPLVTVEGVDNPFRYSGEYWDKGSELQYLRARWYDPGMGRFISEDTYEGELNNPLSLNLYTYVHNNPLKYIDPTGHFIATITGAILGGLIGGITAAFQGTDVLSGVAGGGLNGAVVGGAIDITVATGGTATTLLVATFAAGAVGAASGDYVNQVGNNLAKGKSFNDSVKDVSIESILISAGIGAASGALGGATSVALEAFESGTKKLIHEITLNVLKTGDNQVVKNVLSSVHKVAVRSANTSVTVEYTTSIIYNSSQNTITYMVNNQLVQSVKLDFPVVANISDHHKRYFQIREPINNKE
ncbi:S8 family serine peptidase [Paenibacillus sp. SYP-B4298]|uniref:S8 family serine peptidase n=1 Tax=Paenibacillus sp. SYP-B4298 TaxID=2996034 RepID=UPI0022DE2E8C|nr:S8 family serine peptidase [Paenibacillus sp. SYP-B4298]